jgi:hypothetical protein
MQTDSELLSIVKEITALAANVGEALFEKVPVNDSDEDGFMEGQISNKDQINVIYRHLSSSDTIVAVGTWTKKK